MSGLIKVNYFVSRTQLKRNDVLIIVRINRLSSKNAFSWCQFTRSVFRRKMALIWLVVLMTDQQR